MVHFKFVRFSLKNPKIWDHSAGHEMQQAPWEGHAAGVQWVLTALQCLKTILTIRLYHHLDLCWYLGFWSLSWHYFLTYIGKATARWPGQCVMGNKNVLAFLDVSPACIQLPVSPVFFPAYPWPSPPFLNSHPLMYHLPTHPPVFKKMAGLTCSTNLNGPSDGCLGHLEATLILPTSQGQAVWV